MDADEFRDYILGFIFYKYLSEKMELYANDILKEDKTKYVDIPDTDDIPQEFEKFWTVEQEKAFLSLVEEERLSKEKTQTLIENFLYSEQEPRRDEILELLTGKKPTLLERKPLGDRILKKIMNFVETFVIGLTGAMKTIPRLAGFFTGMSIILQNIHLSSTYEIFTQVIVIDPPTGLSLKMSTVSFLSFNARAYNNGR